ncbi:hypothetical protein CPB85DRAFT_1287820 [Mucidula mucida]|nr:hypothetical protein CPB85DRAFT_1287820 [Mucidula mucida]
MYGVVRFLDTEPLPASTPEDYPKIIKSGIDEEGQHHKSPRGPSGTPTDPQGTKDFDLLVDTGREHLLNVYLHRKGYNIEMGFVTAGKEAQHGVRYIMVEDDKYHVRKWLPSSTSDLGSAWGGSHEWSIWFNELWGCKIEASWTGITEEQKTKMRRGMKSGEESHDDKGDQMEKVMQRYYNRLKWCRAQCGEKKPSFLCSKILQCWCQKEDWKYHKTYCGTETPIPEQYC